MNLFNEILAVCFIFLEISVSVKGSCSSHFSCIDHPYIQCCSNNECCTWTDYNAEHFGNDDGVKDYAQTGGTIAVGIIIAIVVAIIIGIVACVVGCVLCCRRSSNNPGQVLGGRRVVTTTTVVNAAQPGHAQQPGDLVGQPQPKVHYPVGPAPPYGPTGQPMAPPPYQPNYPPMQGVQPSGAPGYPPIQMPQAPHGAAPYPVDAGVQPQPAYAPQAHSGMQQPQPPYPVKDSVQATAPPMP